jgi:glycosyltransferase involved in cell wall biosynthesis
VESILFQTLPVLEIILVDDGSTEHTPEAVQRYIEERPEWRKRVRYYYQRNQGQSAANNVGIAMAKGDWLAFDGSDDIWLPQKLEWQFRALECYHEESGVCFTDGWFMNNPHMKLSLFDFARKPFSAHLGIVRDPVRMLVSDHPVWMQTVVARSDLVRHVGGLDARLRYSEDHDFLFRLSLITAFCFVNMPLVLVDRSPAENRHCGRAKEWHKEEFTMRMNQLRFETQQELSTGLPRAVRRAISQNLRSIHSAWTNHYLANGDFNAARESVSRALAQGLTLGTAAKWALIHTFPQLILKILAIKDLQADARYDRSSWTATSTSPAGWKGWFQGDRAAPPNSTQKSRLAAQDRAVEENSK